MVPIQTTADCTYIFFHLLAGSGGALRLSGLVTMTDLVFQGNRARAAGFEESNAAAGPAVSNLGTISEMTNMTFIDNTFYCSEGTYVDYIQVNLNTGVCSMI